MKIALAHDSFTQLGGAERVVEAFHELYPQAPVFTLALDRKLKHRYSSWDIRTSWLQILYNFIPKLQYLLPFIPLAVSSLDFSGYDIVLSSSSGFIKNIKVPENTIHINYCHTPARFLWSEPEYINQEVPLFLRPSVRFFLKWMRKWDFKGAQRVTKFVANSKEVQKRIYTNYFLPSTVIYPPIDVAFWHPDGPKSGYFLLAGRLQAHKNNEMIVEVFNELGLPLNVVGTGRQENYLKSIAKPNIKFFGHVSDEALRVQYSGASAFLYPQVEDLGLMPLEAASCGTPTIAYAKGGSLETVIPATTGELFKTTMDLKQLILNWQPQKYRVDFLQSQAKIFSKEKFKSLIFEFIKNENRG